MQIQLIAVGNKMPSWVQQGYLEYAGRMPHECHLALKEIAPGKRGKNSDTQAIVREEGERMLKSLEAGMHLVTLDIPGKSWSTEDLANSMRRWLQSGKNIALLIGGPEGLAPEIKQGAHESWSLSRLTLPHPMVRVIVAEQLYRAWSILQNHPYHRQ